MPRKKEFPYQTEGDIFATRLREVMAERGENQTTLAAKITQQSGTIQRQSISQYMQGQSKPDTVRLTAICKALNVSADYLLGLTEHETPDLDLRSVCEYTGLSEASIEKLHFYSSFYLFEFEKALQSDSFSLMLLSLNQLCEYVINFQQRETNLVQWDRNVRSCVFDISEYSMNLADEVSGYRALQKLITEARIKLLDSIDNKE